MSSGDVLFILAFIVLPTAVLVSSIWAVVFVRRRPDRVRASQPENQVELDQGYDPAEEDTVIAAAVARPETMTPSETTEAVDDDLTVDVASDGDDSAWAEADPVEVEPGVEVSPETTVPEPGQETETDSQQDLLATQVVQTTEDMEAVVERVARAEAQREEAETEGEPDTDDTVAVPEAEDTQPAASSYEEDAYEESITFTQTSELPVVPPATESSATSATAAEQTDAPEQGRLRDQESSPRRRRQVRLRPADSDNARHRGRNREAPRQVPRLGRWTRRGGDSTTDRPADGESGSDSSERHDR